MDINDALAITKNRLRDNPDHCAQYYYGLLNDEVFCGFVQCAIDEPNNIDQVCLEVAKNGYNRRDVLNCLSIMSESPVLVNGKEKWFLPCELVFPIISKNRSRDDVGKYYFTLKYEESAACFIEESSKIIIESNIIDCKRLVEQFSLDNPLFIFNNEGKDLIVSTGEAEFAFIANGRYGVDSVLDRNNMLEIRGDSITLVGLYNVLRRYASNVYECVNVLKAIDFIKQEVKRLPAQYQVSQLSKYIKTDACEKLKLKGITTLDDLIKADCTVIESCFVEELIKALTKEQYGLPLDLLLCALKRIKSEHGEVIFDRFFGEKVETLESLSSKTGITREAVRQKEKKALIRLRQYNGIWEQVKRELYLISKFEHFITTEELEAIDISKACCCFLQKATEMYELNNELGILIFAGNNEYIDQCVILIDKLPDLLPVEGLQCYVDSIFSTMEGHLSKDEIVELIKRKYDCSGVVCRKNKLRMSAVLSFVLEEVFPAGIAIYDDKAISLLRDKTKELFNGYELSEKDRAVRARLQDICIPIGKGIWKLDKHEELIPDELQNRIIHYISEYKIAVVPVATVFLAFREELFVVGIDNRYFLQGQLRMFLPKEFSLTRDYILKDGANNLYLLVENYIKEADHLVTRQEIKSEFPGISDMTFLQIVNTTGVMNMNGYYVHVDNLDLTEKDISDLKESVDAILTDESIYHARTIFNSCKKRFEGLFARIGINHYLQFFYLIHEFFPNDYEYNRPYIAVLGVDVIGGEGQLVAKLSPRDITTIAEIREYAKQIGVMIDSYISFIDRHNDIFVFLNENSIVSLNYLDVEEDKFGGLDDVLHNFMGENNYRPLNEFFDYWKLPQLKVEWSEWLLYSIINKYSEDFSVRVSSNMLSEAVPILISNTFDDSDADFSTIRKVQTGLQNEILDLFDIDDLT